MNFLRIDEHELQVKDWSSPQPLQRLGFGNLIARYLADSRRVKNTQLRLADLLRQSVYSRIAGYDAVNDAERLSPPSLGNQCMMEGQRQSETAALSHGAGNSAR